MNKELDKKLFDRFSFFKPKKSLMESLMGFGFECDDGWFDIIYSLCEEVEKLIKDIKDFEVIQVKEKFGGLRFYTNFSNEEISKLIMEAMKKSQVTCEICGKKGTLCDKGSWVKTLCEEHMKEFKYELTRD